MRTLTEVSVRNFLSFRQQTVSLSSLNVLVGPNGAGKTNFLKVFQFVAEVAKNDLVPAIQSFNGMDQIRFRSDDAVGSCTINIKGIITEFSSESALDEYSLTFSEAQRLGRSALARRTETIVFKRTRGRGRRITVSGGKVNIVDSDEGKGRRGAATNSNAVAVQSSSSGLSLIRRLGEEYGASQVNAIALIFEDLRLLDVDVPKARLPSSVVSSPRLLADGSNIAAHLLWLKQNHEEVFAKLCDDIRYVLHSFEDFRFVEIGGAENAVRVEIKERLLRDYTPMARVSFGTIRSIVLFAMLHDPNPPRLTCLEEVDHGLHPHALDRLVERLRDASVNTQFIVATHSPALVNRLEPAELIVFERDEETSETTIVDVTPEQIAAMQNESGYGLGELWFSGSLGGGL